MFFTDKGSSALVVPPFRHPLVFFHGGGLLKNLDFAFIGQQGEVTLFPWREACTMLGWKEIDIMGTFSVRSTNNS